jgi:O-antigen/teichoic acid export membrane protein
MNIDSIKPSLDKEILRYIWPSVWRCGIGVLLTNGTIQGSSLVYSVVGDVKQVASYLLSLRIMRTIAQFSQAPFYSKIPRLAALRAQGAVSEQVSQARKGMRWAYWAYVLPFVLLGAFGQKLLLLIESNATLVSQSLWCLLGFALLIERYCGMHAQLYTTTNHILWHITNGITGLLFLLFSCSFFPFVGVYAFPIAIILSHLSFYAWYITKHSYKACSISFRTFDLPVFIPPLLVVICYTMIMFFL